MRFFLCFRRIYKLLKQLIKRLFFFCNELVTVSQQFFPPGQPTSRLINNPHMNYLRSRTNRKYSAFFGVFGVIPSHKNAPKTRGHGTLSKFDSWPPAMQRLLPTPPQLPRLLRPVAALSHAAPKSPLPTLCRPPGPHTGSREELNVTNLHVIFFLPGCAREPCSDFFAHFSPQKIYNLPTPAKKIFSWL